MDLRLSRPAPAQNTYVWDLSQNPPWLDPAMAEELRNNIEALRMLEQEHGQVCQLFPNIISSFFVASDKN